MSLSQHEILAVHLETVPPEEWESEILAIASEVFPGVETIADFDAAVAHNWDWYGRPEQIWRPGAEVYTMMCAGRGFGKSTAGANACHLVGLNPELCGGRPAEGPDDRAAGAGARFAIAGRTANEVNTRMVDGETGIMAVCDPALRPVWHRQDRTLTWPTGVVAQLMSADVPDSLRGPNNGWFWADELAHWRRLREAWKQLKYTHRLASPGQHPRGLITTTPLGLETICEIAWTMREGQPVVAPPGTPQDRIFEDAAGNPYLVNPRTRIVAGSSYDNVSNLATEFLRDTIAPYEGTDDGIQEIHGRIRRGAPGSPFRLEWIRRCEADEVPALDRRVVFVDPTVSEHEKPPTADEPCECGIVAAGFEAARRRMYALEDGSLTAAPHVWAERVVDLVLRHRATEVVCEDNNGGALLKIVLAQALRARRAEVDWTVKITLCTARADKLGRAVLAAPCWQQGKVWHVGSPRGWIALESQLVQLDPNRPIKSQRTDRLDAVVWGALTFFGDGTDQVKPWPLDGAERWAKIVATVTASRGQASLPRRR